MIRNRLRALEVLTWIALFLILVHGVYHAAEISQAQLARRVQMALAPFFAPTPLGWTVHVAVELWALAALAFAIFEYRRASDEIAAERALTDTEDEFDL